ncbi:MAG: cupredoxin domain-containing protein, partial [Acidimicrobiales bacterium]
MPPEYIIGYVMLAAIVALGAGFIFTAINARKGPDDYEPIHHSGYAVRRYWFVGLMCIGLTAFGFTLPHMPNPFFRKPIPNDAMVVNVTGQQWSWTLTPDTIPANRDVVFRVTSDDVNHGFGIFNPNGNIVGQVQAMPGYTNSLYYKFSNSGTYTIRCLELCGLYHTAMVSSLTVTPAGAPTAISPQAAGTCKPNGTSLAISAHDIKFDKSCLAAPASVAFTITFKNEDAGVPHDVAIYTNSSATTALFKGAIVTGPTTTVYHVPALKAGTYYFRCD